MLASQWLFSSLMQLPTAGNIVLRSCFFPFIVFSAHIEMVGRSIASVFLSQSYFVLRLALLAG